MSFLIDTNILIYHTVGSAIANVVNDLKLVTRNPDDLKGLTALQIVNPFE